MNRERLLALFRTELATAEVRLSALQADAEAAEARIETANGLGIAAAVAVGDARRAEAAVSAIRKNMDLCNHLRQEIAQLQAEAPEAVRTIKASSDEAAIFELLCESGAHVQEGAR